MRHARQRVDWGIVIVTLLCLLVALPFIVRQGLPRTNASEHFVFMTANYAESFSEGRLYPRWSAYAANGYGAPIPNFYPPGAAYLSATIDQLFANNPVQATRITFVLAIVAAGTMTYVFVLREAGAGPAVLAAALYVLSPYAGQTVPYIQGDLNMALALGFLPMLLWSTQRLLRIDTPYDPVMVSVSTAALIFTAPHMAVMGLGLALIIVVDHAWRRDRPGRIFTVVLAVGGGMLLSSIYWLPAWLERDLAQWRPTPIEPVDFRLTLGSIFSPLRRIDLGELVATPHFTLGLPAAIALCAGWLVCISDRQRNLWTLGFLAAAAGGLTLGLAVLPAQTWLLGPITFCAAVSGSRAVSGAGHWLPFGNSSALPLILLTALALSGPVLLAPYWPPDFGETSAAAQVTFEQQGYGIAVLSPGNPVPATIAETLAPDRYVTSSLPQGLISRVTISYNPMLRLVTPLRSLSHSDLFQVRVADEQARITVSRAYFPGWAAYLDDQPVALSRDNLTGLIELLISGPTSGELRLTLDSTAIRQTAWALFWTAVAALTSITFLRLRVLQPRPFDDLHMLPITDARLLGLVVIGYAGLMAGLTTPNPVLTLHARPGHGLDNTYAIQSRTDSGLELISYRVGETRVDLGGTIDLMLAWRTSRSLRDNYRVRVQLRDRSGGARWIEIEKAHPGSYPTGRWTNERYVRDYYRIDVPPDIVPGDYVLTVELQICHDAQCSSGRLLTYFDTAGSAIGPTYTLPVIITVEP